jgi:hypothetical protein
MSYRLWRTGDTKQFGKYDCASHDEVFVEPGAATYESLLRHGNIPKLLLACVACADLQADHSSKLN